MSAIKQEQFEIETAVFQCRVEGGVQAVRALLLARQARINNEWYNLSGEALIEEKGEARAIARLLKTIEQGPTYKQPQ